MVNINDYCKNPTIFQTSLSDTQVSYFNSVCDARNGMGKTFEDNMKKWLDSIGKDVKDMAEHIPEFIMNMVLGILSPQGLSVMSIQFGVQMTPKLINAIIKESVSIFDKEFFDKASEKVATYGLSMVINSIVTTAITRAGEAVARMSRIALKAATMLEDVTDPLFWIIDITNILGMVLDMLPNRYTKELTAEALTEINNSFNNLFMTMFLADLILGQDDYGKILYSNEYPGEFEGFSLLETLDHSDDRYKNMYFENIIDYFKSLEFNSDGVKIDWDVAGHDGSNLANVNFSQMLNGMAIELGDGNTVVANVLVVIWPIIFAVLLVFIIVLLKIK